MTDNRTLLHLIWTFAIFQIIWLLENPSNDVDDWRCFNSSRCVTLTCIGIVVVFIIDKVRFTVRMPKLTQLRDNKTLALIDQWPSQIRQSPLRKKRLPSLYIPRVLEILPVHAGAKQVGKLRIYNLRLRKLWA